MKQTMSWHELILPAGVVGCLLVLIVPLPAMLLDLLLAANIAAALILLLTTISVRTPLEFSIFPSLLLTTTLSRLVLNVASTRLILTRASGEQLDAAGHVIRAFGEFVAGDHLVVGLVIFGILVVIQFVVITQGASRVSEVAARFTLDAMPGRQMAIDADLNAGAIDASQAHARRMELYEQADFYGAMDGACRFVRGDAIAGVVITLINIVGGLSIGVLEHGMPVAQAASLYSRLTIGDGLVSQVPALLISLGTGLLVTRSARPLDLPREFLRQLFFRPRVLAVAAGFLGLLVFTRLPAVPLLAIAAGCAGLAIAVSRKGLGISSPADEAPAAEPPRGQGERRIEDFLAVEPMELELGLQLIRLADASRGGDLLAQITEARRRVAADLGIVLPRIRIRDNLQLDRRDYRIKIAGSPVARGTAYPNRLLAIGGEGIEQLNGIASPCSPSLCAAAWIEVEQLDAARIRGCTVLEPAAAIAAHVQRVAREHAAELLTRDAARHLVEELRNTAPAVVEELVPGVLKLGEVQRVLQRLLEEGVPLRPLGAILEAVGDHAHETRDPALLAEHARRRLARMLSTRFRDSRQILRAVTLDADLEERLAAAVPPQGESPAGRLPPQVMERLAEEIALAMKPLVAGGYPPLLLTGPALRASLKQWTASLLPELIVLSHDELTRDTRVESWQTVGHSVSKAA